MLDAPFGLAFSAGMLATVNPCGFAMLPAYLGFFVGSGESGRRSRALVVSASMTGGFLVVFGTVGLLVETVASSIDQHLAKATVVVGLALVAVGAWLLAGRQLRLRGPHLERGGRDRSVASMFVFGVSYAVASLSCTLGPLLVVLTPTFGGDGIAAGVAAFGAYALGMGTVVTIATVAAGGARDGIVTWLRRSGALVNRVAGGLLVLAGLYVTWYGAWDVRGDFDGDPVIDTAARVQRWLAARVDAIPPLGALGVLGAVAIVVALAGRRRRAGHGKAPAPERVLSS